MSPRSARRRRRRDAVVRPARRRDRRPPGRPTARDRPATFAWGERTFVMGILNVTPDSFSGDGLLARRRRPTPSRAAVDAGAGDGRRRRRPPRRRRRVDAGRATRPSTPTRRSRRVVPVIAALRDGAARTCRSASTRRSPPSPRPRSTPAPTSSTTSGASADDDALRPRRRRARRADRPHAQPRRGALHEPRWPRSSPTSRPRSSGRCGPASRGTRSSSIPGFGFGKTAEHNLALLRDLDAICGCSAGRSCSGHRASRRSARSSTCPPIERLEATLATTALGDRRRRRHRPGPRRPRERSRGPDGGCDRPRRRGAPPSPSEGDSPLSDRIVLHNMQFQGRHGYYDHELRRRSRSRSTSSSCSNLQPAGIDDDLEKTVDYAPGLRRHPPDRRVDVVPAARGARRGDQPRDPRRLPGRRGRRPGPQAEGRARRPARPRRRSRSGAGARRG